MPALAVLVIPASLILWPVMGRGRRAQSISANACSRGQKQGKLPASALSASSGARLTYANLPLSFEPNYGQTDPEVRYFSRGNGFVVFLTQREAVLVLAGPGGAGETSRDAEAAHETPGRQPPRRTVLRMKPLGSHSACRPVGRDRLPGASNSFIGSDPGKWRTKVPTYARVEYREVYPGVGLVFHGGQRQLEYDFSIAPGADPSVIRLGFEGAQQIRLDVDGSLVLETEGGEIRQEKPFAYQEAEGVRKSVAASFTLRGEKEIGFEVADYDSARPLVIDPVLSYSTYLGGAFNDAGNGIAVDSAGNAYVTGETASLNFPTTSGAIQTSNRGGSEAWVAKLNPTGTALLYSTYLGGTFNDSGAGVAVDSSGNAYVTGETFSTNFPTTAGAFQTTNRGGSEAWVAKLNPTGTALLYSTYLGGTNFSDRGDSIAVDSSGNASVTGRINSDDFPTTAGTFQTSYRGGAFDSFVTKLNPTGTALIYSTYLGGSVNDAGFGIALGPAGNAYVAGGTNSMDFPTTLGAYQPSNSGTDSFMTMLTAAGSGLVYSSFLGGSFSFERANGIAVDSSGNAYVTGFTISPDFPTVNAVQPNYSGAGNDAYASKFNPTLSGFPSLVYSTFLGGNGDDRGNGISVDASGNAHVTGQTSSTNFPTANPLQSAFGGGSFDAFVTMVSPSGMALLFSTYLGGGGEDRGNGIAADPSGNVFLTGRTASTDFPRVNPLQSSIGGGGDAFVARIGAGPAQTPTPTPTGPTPTPTPTGLTPTPTPTGLTPTPTLTGVTATPTPTRSPSATPLPAPLAPVPALSLPMLLLLAVGLAGTALFLLRKP